MIVSRFCLGGLTKHIGTYIIVDTYLICVMPFDQRLSANAVSNREYICGSRNCHQRPNVILYNLA